MHAFWIGKSDPPAGLQIRKVDGPSEINENSIVFVEDRSYMHWQDLAGHRVYIVSDLPVSSPLPKGVSGILPNDYLVLDAVLTLFSEMRHSYEVGDKLIRSLNEKEQAVQEKQSIMLRDSRRYKAIIKNASDLIAVLGPAGRIMFCNETLKQYLGGEGYSLIGASLADLVIDEDRGSIQELLVRNFKQGVPSKAEVRFNLSSGKMGIFSLMSTPLVEEDHIYAISIIGRDITDTRAMQARLSVQAKDLTAMINGLSHELRNPLTVIGAYMRRLERDSDSSDKSEKRERAIAGIMSSITRIEDMVTRIERYESIANMEPYFSAVNLRKLLGDFLKPDRYDVPVTLAESGDIWGYTDAEHIKIAVRRLLENAVQSGTDRIEISLEDHGVCGQISIRDYGAGFKEAPEVLFGPFYSSDPMKVGLGLTEARIAMIKVGGEIDVNSEVESGACFILRVPLDRRRRSRG